MAQVFISYSQQDRARVRALVEALEGAGLTVFWDPKLRAGEVYRVVLRSELDAAECVVVVWSGSSVRSDWVIWEASHGKRRKILVPVLIDDLDVLELPPEFSGQHAQRIDVGDDDLAEQMRRFTADVVAVVGPSDVNEVRAVRPPGGARKRVHWRSIAGSSGAIAALGIGYWMLVGSKAMEEPQASRVAAPNPVETPASTPEPPVSKPSSQSSRSVPSNDVRPMQPEVKPTSVSPEPKQPAGTVSKLSETPPASASPTPSRPSAPSLDGTGESEYNLARQYELGRDTNKNEAEAFKLYRQSVEAGFEPAVLPYARMLRDGRGTTANPAEAAKYFQSQADRGRAEAQFELAKAYFDGKGVGKNEPLGAKWLTAAAEQGHSTAQNDLGRAYALGLGVEQNDKTAAAWYFKAAAQGQVIAQENLGHFYRLGRGVRQSDTEAFSYFMKAAKQELPSAQHRVGLAYLNGTGVVKDLDAARMWLQRSADNGDKVGQAELALLHEREKNQAEAIRWYQKSADQNHAFAQMKLGIFHSTGNGVPKDRDTALKLLRLAANQSQSSAQAALAVLLLSTSSDAEEIKEGLRWAHASADASPHVKAFLGFAYETGHGVARDDATAVKWYRGAAADGVALAQAGLGRMLSAGRGVERNEQEGLEWLLKAAGQGERSAEYVLGRLYLGGNSAVARDPAIAMDWFKKAMDHGHAEAKLMYAGMLMGDAGVPVNKPEAVRLLHESAEEGSKDAAMMLGSLYEKGDGVTKSLKKAKEWYAVAAKRGHAPAQKELDRLGK